MGALAADSNCDWTLNFKLRETGTGRGPTGYDDGNRRRLGQGNEQKEAKGCAWAGNEKLGREFAFFDFPAFLFSQGHFFST